MLSQNSCLLLITSILASTPFLTSAAIGVASLLLVAYLDYHHYCSQGNHGLPGNFSGWKKQLQWSRIARKDTRIPAPYNINDIKQDYGPHATMSFLKAPLNEREGGRPNVLGFVAPHRQVTETASPEMKQHMSAYLDSLVEINSKLLTRELSRLEGPFPAVQVQSSIPMPTPVERTRGEIIHVHPQDGSTHIVLSLEDSRTVIEKRWGERHRLSGGDMLPWTYTLIYAPRNEGEFSIWKDVMEAAAGFCCAESGNIVGID